MVAIRTRAHEEAHHDAVPAGEAEDIGNVDFTNDEGTTIVTVHVSRSDDGMYTVHLMPMWNDDQIRVELHREEDLAVIEPCTSRPVWTSDMQAATPARTSWPQLSTPAAETAESQGEETRMIAEMIQESFSHVVLVTGSRSWDDERSMRETFNDAWRDWAPRTSPGRCSSRGAAPRVPTP
ncbi:hypothetical protein [Kitasatospora sp. NPDC087315]|uniref:hypothetical protein n=1 Tax=Kitasatospora sp. NPDC087315 TaxID=3364069 RepID=UPI003810F321